MNIPIGIDRRIRVEWLQCAADSLIRGHAESEIRDELRAELEGYLSIGKSTVGRGSGEKTITNLIKIWVRVPKELQPLRDAGLEIIAASPKPNHLAVHWGMIMAVYPFWGEIAMHAGRLLRLQGAVSAEQTQRRLRETYGERTTVKDATRRVLRSMHDWAVLQETGTRGIYGAGKMLAVDNPRFVAWLAEAYLHARGKNAVPVNEMIDSPSLFPFQITPVHAEGIVAQSSRLDFIRHGLDANLIMLRHHGKVHKT